MQVSNQIYANFVLARFVRQVSSTNKSYTYKSSICNPCFLHAYVVSKYQGLQIEDLYVVCIARKAWVSKQSEDKLCKGLPCIASRGISKICKASKSKAWHI